MKNFFRQSTFIFLAALAAACTDNALVENPSSSSEQDFNIEGFSKGYSVAFDISLDPMGGNSYTRADEVADVTDTEIQEWENHLDPEEFRVLFFDSQDRFLFESRSRWFAQIASENGGRRWRVGIPIFQYLSDGYDPNISEKGDWSMDDAYNWDRIIEIMKTESFKIAILANRPSKIIPPEISDWTNAVKIDNLGQNGPFWGPKNSVASYAVPQEHTAVIKDVFDLHHCQYDPFYHSKTINANGTGCYDFIAEWTAEGIPDGASPGSLIDGKIPYMGAVSSWLNPYRKRGTNPYYFYRLPKDRLQDVLTTGTDATKKDTDIQLAEDQYIPMYGIQRFEPLSTWVKGTTYNLSQQTGSQTGEYDYKGISLLRSVVKLELRIPMYENGQKVKVENAWAQLYSNNFMARCEPMDVWTPTNEIWSSNHAEDCEWLSIRNYGLYANSLDQTAQEDYRQRLSWYFGVWREKGWKYEKFQGDHSSVAPTLETTSTKYPRIFNPITQRLTCSLVTDCYLPIDKGVNSQSYHRWIVYCGEKNMNDPNQLNNLASTGYINYFRIQVTRPGKSPQNYNLPITDYSKSGNPILKYIYDTEDITSIKYHANMSSSKATDVNYCYDVKRATSNALYPYPLLRNHHYRITVSFGDGDDINVAIMDGEKRTVGDIIFK